jgi:hypothetical protein
MTIPNDDSKPDQPAAAPQPPVAPSSDIPPAPPAPPAAPAAPEAPAFPAYAAAPAAPVAPVAAPTAPPSSITIAFWLFIASAALSVISGIITLIAVANSRASLLDSINSGGTSLKGISPDSFVNAAIGFGITWAIITMIFWVAVFVLFAVFMRRGANWARIVLTVLTVLSLFNVAAGLGAGAVQVIAAIVATVLIWLKPASAYFAAVKASKAPRA